MLGYEPMTLTSTLSYGGGGAFWARAHWQVKKKKKKSLKSKKLQISNKIKKEKETNSLVTLIQSKRD